MADSVRLKAPQRKTRLPVGARCAPGDIVSARVSMRHGDRVKCKSRAALLGVRVEDFYGFVIHCGIAWIESTTDDTIHAKQFSDFEKGEAVK